MKKLILLKLFLIPHFLWAITVCSCWSSFWTSSGWVAMHFHYATNNGSCIPSGSNTYNFGSVEVFHDGEYLGSVNFGSGSGSNINDYLSCGIA